MLRILKNSFKIKNGTLLSFRNHLEMDEKSQATICKYMHDVEMFFSYLTCSNRKNTFRKEDVIAYKKWLSEKYAGRSVNSMLTALNRFLCFLGAEKCCVKLLRIQSQTFCEKRRELSRKEYVRLLNTAWEKGDVRLFLILQTLCATGIRVSELQYVTVSAAKSGTATARNKGKTRLILLPSQLCRLLVDYAQKKGIQSGPIFITRGGRPVDRSNIWAAMKKLSMAAGVEASKVFPHNLRHLFARTFYQKEKDITRLADILGHKSINTTRVYMISSGWEHRTQIESLDLTFSCQGLYLKGSFPHNNMLCSKFIQSYSSINWWYEKCLLKLSDFYTIIQNYLLYQKVLEFFPKSRYNLSENLIRSCRYTTT